MGALAATSFDDVVNNKRAKEKEANSNRLLFMPGSPVLNCWRALVSISVLWAVSVTPLELAFSWWDPGLFFAVAAKFVDIACYVDMVVNFNAAKLEHGRMVTDRFQIAKSYLKSWFIIDFLTNFPWDYVLANKEGSSRKLAKILKLPKLFRIFRLLRFAQEEAYYFGSIFSLFLIVFLAHYIACLWAWMLIDCGEEDGFSTCPPMLPTYFEGLSVGMATIGGSDGWMRYVISNYQLTAGSDAPDAAPGEGPVSGVVIRWKTPNDALLEFSASMTSVAGFCVLAMLFANVAHTIGKSGAQAIIFHERLSNLKAAAQQHNIPRDLFRRVKQHFHYVWSCGSDASRALLRDTALTVDLRRQLALCFYGHSLRQVPFLQGSEEGFLKQLCERVEMECFSPADRVIVAGEMGTELYFLIAGRMRIELPESGKVIKRLHEGSFFGEMGVLFPGTARTVNVIAETFGWALIIDRIALEEICTEELLDTFRSVARARFDENRTSQASNVPGGAAHAAVGRTPTGAVGHSTSDSQASPSDCEGEDEDDQLSEDALAIAVENAGLNSMETANIKPPQSWVAKKNRASVDGRVSRFSLERCLDRPLAPSRLSLERMERGGPGRLSGSWVNMDYSAFARPAPAQPPPSNVWKAARAKDMTAALQVLEQAIAAVGHDVKELAVEHRLSSRELQREQRAMAFDLKDRLARLEDALLLQVEDEEGQHIRQAGV